MGHILAKTTDKQSIDLMTTKNVNLQSSNGAQQSLTKTDAQQPGTSSRVQPAAKTNMWLQPFTSYTVQQPSTKTNAQQPATSSVAQPATKTSMCLQPFPSCTVQQHATKTNAKQLATSNSEQKPVAKTNTWQDSGTMKKQPQPAQHGSTKNAQQISTTTKSQQPTISWKLERTINLVQQPVRRSQSVVKNPSIIITVPSPMGQAVNSSTNTAAKSALVKSTAVTQMTVYGPSSQASKYLTSEKNNTPNAKTQQTKTRRRVDDVLAKTSKISSKKPPGTRQGGRRPTLRHSQLKVKFSFDKAASNVNTSTKPAKLALGAESQIENASEKASKRTLDARSKVTKTLGKPTKRTLDERSDNRNATEKANKRTLGARSKNKKILRKPTKRTLDAKLKNRNTVGKPTKRTLFARSKNGNVSRNLTKRTLDAKSKKRNTLGKPTKRTMDAKSKNRDSLGKPAKRTLGTKSSNSNAVGKPSKRTLNAKTKNGIASEKPTKWTLNALAKDVRTPQKPTKWTPGGTSKNANTSKKPTKRTMDVRSKNGTDNEHIALQSQEGLGNYSPRPAKRLKISERKTTVKQKEILNQKSGTKNKNAVKKDKLTKSKSSIQKRSSEMLSVNKGRSESNVEDGVESHNLADVKQIELEKPIKLTIVKPKRALLNKTVSIMLTKLTSSNLRRLGCTASCPHLLAIEEKEGVITKTVPNDESPQLVPLTHHPDFTHIPTNDKISYLKGLLKAQRANLGL